MQNDDSKLDLDEVLKSLITRSDISDLKLEKEWSNSEIYGIRAGASFVLNFNGSKQEVFIGLNEKFPYSLPEIFLNRNKFGVIPHVMTNGWVCYYNNEGLTIDYRNPERIVSDSLDILKGKILSLSEAEMRKERLLEFEFYWNKLPKTTALTSLIDIGVEFKEIEVLKNKKRNLKVVCDSAEQVKSYLNTNDLAKDLTLSKAVYLSLDTNNLDTPDPNNGWQIKTIREIIRNNISSDRYEIIKKKLLKRKVREKELLLLSFPRDANSKTLIGLEFRNSRKQYPILDESEVLDITPIKINRHDYDFITERGGVSNNLKDKNVLLVGLGSIGGFIASGLADCGLRKLTVVDKENLEIGNVYRHLLGRSSVGDPKSKAVKNYLEREYPYLNISEKKGDIIDLIKTESIDLRVFDLIIVAIGHPATELHLNEIFRKLNLKKVIYTWLEPFDIGGQMLKLDYSKRGCYNCIYDFEEIEGKHELINQTSFLKFGQNFEKDLEGCGTSFSPYGVNSAKKTASLVIDQAVDFLNNQNLEPMILSWKGKSDQIHKNGYEVSKRYSLSDKELKSGGKQFVRENCEVCGKK